MMKITHIQLNKLILKDIKLQKKNIYNPNNKKKQTFLNTVMYYFITTVILF